MISRIGIGVGVARAAKPAPRGDPVSIDGFEAVDFERGGQAWRGIRVTSSTTGTIPAGTYRLVMAAGGGGGAGGASGGGGGAGEALVHEAIALSGGAVVLAVGAGGGQAGTTSDGNDGGETVWSGAGLDATLRGGGGGGQVFMNGRPGGSGGGGGAASGSGTSGGASTASDGVGNPGGGSIVSGSAGGGGGAGDAGGSGFPAPGGAGLAVDILDGSETICTGGRGKLRDGTAVVGQTMGSGGDNDGNTALGLAGADGAIVIEWIV